MREADVRGARFAIVMAIVSMAAPAAAVDLANSWGVRINQSGAPPTVEPIRCIWDITTAAGTFSLAGTCSVGPLTGSGTMDASTGAFSGRIDAAVPDPPGFISFDVTGQVAPDRYLIAGTFGPPLAGVFEGTLCGNARADPGETCENGVTPLPCCDDQTCQPAVDGTTCFWGEPDCASGAQCQAGVCQPIPLTAGAPCDRDFDACTREACDGAGHCATTGCSPCCDVAAGCTVPATSSCARSVDGRSTIDVKTGTSRQKLAWSLKHAAAVPLSDLGLPTVSDEVRLCIYDFGLGPKLVLDAVAPAGGTCRDRPCWTATPTGFAYRNLDGAPDGLERVVLVAGAAGVGNVRVGGKGEHLLTHVARTLGARPRPYFLPVTVRLHAGAACWEARYDAAVSHVRQNSDTRFKATGAN
jgi:hypothetical protein